MEAQRILHICWLLVESWGEGGVVMIAKRVLLLWHGIYPSLRATLQSWQENLTRKVMKKVLLYMVLRSISIFPIFKCQ